MADEYYSFEKALRELNLRDEELKRLVSEGEIRAFRDEDKMKFKREDVEKLKTKAGSASDPGSSADTLADDLIFDEDEDLDLLDDEPGMATEQISTPEALDTVEEEVLDLEEEEEEVLTDESVSVRRTTGRGTRIREKAETVRAQEPVMMVFLVLTTAAMIYGMMITLSVARSNNGGMTRGFTDILNSLFGG